MICVIKARFWSMGLLSWFTPMYKDGRWENFFATIIWKNLRRRMCCLALKEDLAAVKVAGLAMTGWKNQSQQDQVGGAFSFSFFFGK